MSTKTTIKRIALVAVSALGLGVLTSVAPASAARTVAAGTNNITGISVSTDYAPVAGALGTSSLHTITWTSDTTTSGLRINPSVILLTMPTSGMTSQTASTALDSATSIADQASGAWTSFTATSITSTDPAGHDVVLVGGTDNIWPSSTSEELALSTANAAGYMTGKSYLQAHYAVAGTYVWQIWEDQNVDGIVNGTEFSTTFTVVVGASSTASVAVASAAALGGSASTVTKVSTTSGNSGALVKISLKDASGNPVAPGIGQTVTVAVNGSAVIAKVNDAAAGSGTNQSYQLAAGDFDGSGSGYINVTDATAESVTLTTTGAGWGTFTPSSNLGLKFTAVTTGSGTAFANVTGSNLKTVTAGSAYSYNYLGATVTIATNSTSSSVTDNVNVSDTAGYLTGKAGADYDVLVTGAATTGGTISFAMPAKTTSSVTALTLTINGGGSTTISSATASAYTVAVYSPTVAAQRAASGSAVPMTVRVKNEFGQVVNGILVTASISGRNSGVAIASVSTNASGIATLTYTDASTSTTSLRDVVTLTVSGATTNATVTTDFTSDATLGVSTVLATSNQTSSTTGADLPVITNWQINAGDGAQSTLQTVTATVKDANGVALAGVPVTFSVAGTGAAILSTTKTVYTDSDGKAATSVFAWISGKYVVTATAGGKSDTINTYFAQEDGATYLRTFTAAQTSDRVVTVTAYDRFGNLAKGASFTASLSGDAFFGTGVNYTTGVTSADGTVKFVVLESNKDTVMTIQAGGSATYAQTDAPKGNVSSATTTDVFTAYTAGTATTADEGVGASYDVAGVNALQVTIPGSSTTASESIDAANEATDAANAATDAANAAAEAADAATAAAQDAQAAVAALATQVASLIAGIKAQITTLTNLVIKIQKKVKA